MPESEKQGEILEVFFSICNLKKSKYLNNLLFSVFPDDKMDPLCIWILIESLYTRFLFRANVVR